MTHQHKSRSFPSLYWPLGPHRLGNSRTATPRFPLNAKNEPSCEAVIFSTVKSTGDVGSNV